MRALLTALVLGSAATSVVLPAAPPTEVTVEIRLFQLQPDSLEVAAGVRVRWINRDDIAHTVTAGIPDSGTGAFDAALAGRDSAWAMTFGQPGRYAYYCDRHHFMRGIIRVTSTRKAGQ